MKKSDYRKYQIKTVEGVDDFASMREVVGRRYRRLQEEQRAMPSLVLIDGGLGQLHAAAEALESLGITTQPLASIAKREEIIYLYGQEDEPIVLDRRSPVLHLVQRIRDESHRFAVTYHRKRREIRDRESESVDDSRRWTADPESAGGPFRQPARHTGGQPAGAGFCGCSSSCGGDLWVLPSCGRIRVAAGKASERGLVADPRAVNFVSCCDQTHAMPSSSSAPDLPRVLGVWHATAIVVGTIIGSGIFLVPQEMMRRWAPAGWFTWPGSSVVPQPLWRHDLRGAGRHDAARRRRVCLSPQRLRRYSRVSLHVDLVCGGQARIDCHRHDWLGSYSWRFPAFAWLDGVVLQSPVLVTGHRSSLSPSPG